jgi:hypothetical protein
LDFPPDTKELFTEIPTLSAPFMMFLLPSFINFKLSSLNSNLYEIMREILTSVGRDETSPVSSGGEGYTGLCGEG